MLRLTTGMSQEPEVIVLGAGILGCALAWRLAAHNLVGGESILVVDPKPAASQATSRAAGLLSMARPAARSHWIPLVQKTLTIVDELNSAGQSVPLHRCGSLHLAASARTQALLADYEATAASNEVSCRRVRPQEWSGRLPWLDLKRFSEGLWFPEEGYAVHIDGKVLTPTSVWVAAGAWSNSLLSQLGASAPQAAVRSQYWITETTALATGDMPIVLAADLRLYACRLQWRRHCRFCRIGRSGGQLREWRSEWRGSVPTNPLRVRRFRCAGVSCALHCGACRQNQWIAREAIADAGTDTLLSHSCRVRHIESQVSRFAGSTSPTGVSK